MDDIKDIVLFETEDKNVMIDVALVEETVWLTKKQMVDLFGRERTVISRHISNIFEEGELEQKSNVHFLHVPNSNKPVEALHTATINTICLGVWIPMLQTISKKTDQRKNGWSFCLTDTLCI